MMHRMVRGKDHGPRIDAGQCASSSRRTHFVTLLIYQQNAGQRSPVESVLTASQLPNWWACWLYIQALQGAGINQILSVPVIQIEFPVFEMKRSRWQALLEQREFELHFICKTWLFHNCFVLLKTIIFFVKQRNMSLQYTNTSLYLYFHGPLQVDDEIAALKWVVHSNIVSLVTIVVHFLRVMR